MNVCLSDHPDRLELSIFRARGAYGIVVDSAKRDYVAQGGLPEEEFY
eukprot:gene4455-5684_t